MAGQNKRAGISTSQREGFTGDIVVKGQASAAKDAQRGDPVEVNDKLGHDWV